MNKNHKINQNTFDNSFGDEFGDFPFGNHRVINVKSTVLPLYGTIYI